MRDVLRAKNRELADDIDRLLEHIDRVDIPLELNPFRLQIRRQCVFFRDKVKRNLDILASKTKTDLLLEEVISYTSNTTMYVRLMSDTIVPALIRDPYGTQLSQRIILWVHRQHVQSRTVFPATSDGGWSIFSMVQFPIYYIPLLQQNRLLQQPLLFHEFGHLLHRLHQAEVDDLIREFQITVIRKLHSALGSNDRYYEQQLQKNNRIATTWYSWIVEIFCDSVGFTLGGPSYLKAFSLALSSVSPQDFHMNIDNIIGSSHPVTWLRVKFLAERANAEGFVDISNRILSQWNETANVLGIKEDYYGMYDPVLHRSIVDIVDDMIVETDPRRYTDVDLAMTSRNVFATPIRLLDKAWHQFESDPEGYQEWEEMAIQQYLSVDFEPPILKLLNENNKGSA
ncbi:MAG: hypothetical protein AAF846_21365 [Chloroflexota bacterium]